MSTVWVIGAGGLLGSHVSRVARSRGHDVQIERIPWDEPEIALDALRSGTAQLLARPGPWAIAWCAGAGVVATPEHRLQAEVDLYQAFLTELRPPRPGALFLASSAGGVYAGSSEPPFDERTHPEPLAPYGRTKLAMENLTRAWANRAGTPALIGRISNLYGPGQNLDKGQGLVSAICRAGITGQAVSMYVSLDTLRDYLYVEDAARMTVVGLESLPDRGELVTIKILASGRSVTLGALIGESRRVLRRRPRVVFGASPKAGTQVRDLRLRSVVWPELDDLARTTLPAGLAATAGDVVAHLARSRPVG